MKKSFLLTLLAVALIFLWGGARTTTEAQTVEQVVESFFPQRLIDESAQDHANGGPAPFKTSAFVVGDLNKDGSSFIVAAYSNGFAGVVRVLQKTNNTFTLVDESNLKKMSGDFPKVELIDLDNDERPEIIASFASARGPRGVWIFKWTGTGLDLIGPTDSDSNGLVDTRLTDSSFIDLDGDGKLEIINVIGSAPVAPDETENFGRITYEVYALSGHKYVLLSSDFYRQDFFIRQTGAPASQSATFNVQNPNSSYTMSILNGAQRWHKPCQ
jgi:hypothetical protein